MAQKSEFRVAHAYRYDQTNALRWIFSHLWRHRGYFLLSIGLYIVSYISFSLRSGVLIGTAAAEIIAPSGANGLLLVGIAVLVLTLVDGLGQLFASLSIETLAQRLEHNSREELYVSLLGKSQTFHDRQRVGDIMARATDDMQQMNLMINPGVTFIFDTVMGIIVPLTFLAAIRVELLLVPMLFVITYIVTVRQYARRLNPIVGTQREKFGVMNASLEETISGIEIVKASARESFERDKFRFNAREFRKYFVQQGYTEAGYLPLLLYGIALALTFLHGILLYGQGIITIPDIIAVMALMGVLRFPVFISIFSFSLISIGLASAQRILKIISEETELDENPKGYAEPIRGKITFENVSFGFEEDGLLENISFTVQPGETVAIVGMTGSGKSTLTELINRTYDVTTGRILIDDVDVRDWNLT
ncbi:MAG: ABC transporter ATP-binding protein, partial [bacterium]|nr:ABC transporter ATP-binding protein [bacterium]